MNKEVKKLWIEALTSGEYQQAQAELRTERGFCCLGVLCDLHRKATGTGWTTELVKKSDISDEVTIRYSYLDNSSFLPKSVQLWAELHTDDPGVPSPYDDDLTLVKLNDNGSSFKEIAEIIKRVL